jgi:hypothetical protein
VSARKNCAVCSISAYRTKAAQSDTRASAPTTRSRCRRTPRRSAPRRTRRARQREHADVCSNRLDLCARYVNRVRDTAIELGTSSPPVCHTRTLHSLRGNRQPHPHKRQTTGTSFQLPATGSRVPQTAVSAALPQLMHELALCATHSPNVRASVLTHALVSSSLSKPSSHLRCCGCRCISGRRRPARGDGHDLQVPFGAAQAPAAPPRA